MARRKTLLTLLVACLAAFAAALCCALCAQQTHAAAGDAELDKSGAPMQTLAFADVICDDMLYQQGKPVAVWGFAPAGSSITVTLTEQESGDEVRREHRNARRGRRADGRRDRGHRLRLRRGNRRCGGGLPAC